MFGFALFAFQTFQQGTELFDFPAQREHPHLFVAQSALQVFELAEYVAQFSRFMEKRAFRALFAACNRHVMETFASFATGRMRRGFREPRPRAVSDPERCNRRAASEESLPATFQSHRERGWYFSRARSKPWAARSARLRQG